MKKIFLRLFVIALVAINGIGYFIPYQSHAQENNSLPFTDLLPSDKYYQDISELYNKGLVEGYDDNTFKANQLISRAEFVKFTLGAGECVDCRYPPQSLKSQYTQSPFPDISTTAWYFYCIARGKDQGIVTGYLGEEKKGLFVPEDSISRAESIAILLRATGNRPDTGDPMILQDVEESAWYIGYLKKAVNMGLIDYHNGFIAPEEKIQRGEFAHLVNIVMQSQQCRVVQKELPENQNTSTIASGNTNGSGLNANNSTNPNQNSTLPNTNSAPINANQNQNNRNGNRNGNDTTNNNFNTNTNLNQNKNSNANQNRNISNPNNNQPRSGNLNSNTNGNTGNENTNQNAGNTNSGNTNTNGNGNNNSNTTGNNNTNSPIPDRDGDTVPDSSDACPDLPGDLKNAQNQNGCPAVGEIKPTNTKPGIVVTGPTCNMCPCSSVDFKADLRPGDIVFSIISDALNQRIYTKSNLYYTAE